MYDKNYYTDELTGVLNRRYLPLIVNREIARCKRYNGQFSIIVADLDNFKVINDTLGHIKGDKALAVFADIMKKMLRESDAVIRYGGDEFVIILPETSSVEARNAAERILKKLKEINFSGVSLSASMGIATYPQHGTTWEELFNAADRALLYAKRMGKGRVSLFEDTPQKGLMIPTKELIGRREETIALMNMLKKRGMLHGIIGEVGVGKTRLVKDTLKTLKRPFLYVQALGTFGDIPYFVLINLLKELFKSKRADFFITFERLPEPLKIEIAKLLPEVHNDVSIKKEHTGDRYRLFEAVVELLAGIYKNTDPVFVFDDAQWIDRESAGFINYVVHMSEGKFAPVVIVRKEEKENSHINEVIAILTRMRLYDELYISPLPRHATLEMLSAILGGKVDRRLLDVVYKETGGNPFFIEEVIRGLRDSDSIYEEDGVWYIKTGYKLEPSRSVEEVIKRKLRGLSDRERKILVFSAVYGREVDPYVVSRASGINEGEVYDALDRFVQIGLMRENELGEYIFSEGIVIDTVLKTLSKSRLRFYHRKIAEALVEVHTDNIRGIVDKLIYHYDAAGLSEKANKFCKIAAERALGIYAYEMAMKYYKRILKSIETEEEAGDIAHNIYYIFRNLGNMEEFEEAIGVLLKKFPSLAGTIYEMLGDAYTQRGMYQKAEELLRKGIKSAKGEIEKRKLEVRLAWTLLYQNKKKEAKEIVKSALKFYEEKINTEDGKKKTFAIRAMVAAYNTLASIYLLEDNAQKAIEYYGRYLDLLKKEEMENDYNYAVGLVNMAIACVRLDEARRALQYLEEARQISQKLHSIYLTGMVELVMGELYVITGNVEKAGEYLKGAHRKYIMMNNEMRVIETDLILFKYHLYRKNFQKALNVIDEALAFARRILNEEYIVEALKGKIEVLIESGGLEKALFLLNSIYSDYPEMARKLDFPLKLLKARIFMLKGEVEKAKKLYESLLEERPEDTEALLGVAEALMRMKKIEKGVELAKKCENMVFKDDDLYTLILRFRLGEAYLYGSLEEKGLKIMKNLYPILEKNGNLLYLERVAQYIFE